MNINDLTIGQAKELSSIFVGKANDAPGLNSMIGQRVIVRTYSAGNFFGVLEEKSGDEVYLTNARRMWYWKAKQGISLSACALYGVDTEKSKIVEPVARIWVQAIEIIPCTETAAASLEGAPHVQAG